MTTSHSHSPAAATIQARNALWIAVIAAAATFIADVFYLYLYLSVPTRPWQILGLALNTLALLIAGLACIALIRRGRPIGGILLLLGIGQVTFVVGSALVTDLGLVFGLGIALLSAMIAAETLPSRQATQATLSGATAGIVCMLADVFKPTYRLPAPAPLLAFLPGIIGVVALVYSYFLFRQFKFFSLRTKLIAAFLGVALIPLGVQTFLNDRATRASLVDAANRSLFAAASQTATSLDDFFSANLESISTAAQFPALGEYLSQAPEARSGGMAEREVTALLSSLKNRSGSLLGPTSSRILSYSLLDQQGRVVMDTASPTTVGQDFSDTDYFQLPFLDGHPYSSPVEFASGATEPSLYFSARVSNPDLQPAGALVARFDAAVLQELVMRNNDLAGPQSFAVLFDDNFVHLAHGTTPDVIYKVAGPLDPARATQLKAAGRLPDLPAGALSTDLPDLEHNLANAAAQPFFASRDNATGEKVNQVAVTRLTTQPWLVAFFQPQEVFLAPAAAQTRNTLLLAVVIAAVVAGAAVGVAQVLTGPITRLTAVAQQVSAGDLAARARMESGDEIGTLAATFNNMTAQLWQTLESLEQRVAERTAQLQAAADISRATTLVRDLDTLLRLALQLIRERFGFYHASIFLMDKAGEFAVLRESTGEVGAVLKASGHKLGVGSNSLIGWVTKHHQPRVALDTAEDPFHFKNPLLPDTRSELAIPLVVGDRLLGALDVQSTEVNAFSESDVQVLQTLADQLSVAIQNAELFHSTQATLAEVSSLYQQVASAAWRALLQDRPREIVFEFQPGTGEWPPVGGEASVEIPLRVRGEVVGTLELHGLPPVERGIEEQAVLETAATQLSVALESAALIEEAQRRGRREHLINTITYQMRASLNPATIIQSGMRELGKALGATEVIVKLAPTASPTPPGGRQED